MPFFDQQALFAAAGCGSHQQVLGAMIAGGDFTNIATNNAADGIYTLNGVPCDIDDIIDLLHVDTAFDPIEDIDADGIKLTTTSRRLVLVDSLNDSIAASGFTIVVTCMLPADAAFTMTLVTANEEDSDIIVRFEKTFQIELTTSAPDDFSEQVTSNNIQAISRFAVTMTGSDLSMSVNGEAVENHAFSALSNISYTLLRIAGDPAIRLRSFEIYAPVDGADLPALSAL